MEQFSNKQNALNQKIQRQDFIENFQNTKTFCQNWTGAHKAWGGNNGGVVSDLVLRNREGLILKAQGDLATQGKLGVDSKGNTIQRYDRVGSGIVSKFYVGPGSVRINVKLPPKIGCCFALWTYFYQEIYQGDPRWQEMVKEGLKIQGNKESGEYIIRNHEIDIELPTALKNQDEINWKNGRFNTWRGEQYGEYQDQFLNHGIDLSDGKYHELRFDWHTDGNYIWQVGSLNQNDNNRGACVEFYIDGKFITRNTENIPDIAQRLWISYWFPQNWAGKNADWENQECYVQDLKYYPFLNEPFRVLQESFEEGRYKDFTFV